MRATGRCLGAGGPQRAPGVWEEEDVQSEAAPDDAIANGLTALSFQLYQEIEICPKATRSLQLEKSDAAGDSYGACVPAAVGDSLVGAPPR